MIPPETLYLMQQQALRTQRTVEHARIALEEANFRLQTLLNLITGLQEPLPSDSRIDQYDITD